jgi:hypothetical protein
MALQIKSSKTALSALIQGFLVRKTTPRPANCAVWDQSSEQNHIVVSVVSDRSNPATNLGLELEESGHCLAGEI